MLYSNFIYIGSIFIIQIRCYPYDASYVQSDCIMYKLQDDKCNVRNGNSLNK